MSKIKPILLAACLLVSLVMAVQAAPLAADLATNLAWWTADGGGGESQGAAEGGGYTLSATTGQADTGTLQGGSYTLAGGFWSAGPSAPVEIEYRLALPLVMK